jgi:hypothetical protein
MVTEQERAQTRSRLYNALHKELHIVGDKTPMLIKPLYLARTMPMETYLRYYCDIPQYKGNYMILDWVPANRLVVAGRPYAKWVYQPYGWLKSMHLKTLRRCVLFLDKKGIIDPDYSVRFSLRWLWEGYKRAKAKRKG